MNRELISVIEQIGREKGIDKEILFEAVESALQSACRKSHTGPDNVRIEIDRKTGEFSAFLRKRVVEEVADTETEISLAEAKKLNAEAELDVELEIKQERPPQDLGRIAAQTAKQVILQKVRDAEREGIYSEFAGKESQILRGIVHRIEKRNVILEIGKAEAILPEREQIPGERYNPGDRIRAYVLEVRRTAKGPQISLSRTHPGYLTRLFQTEIPEIQEGIVLVKATAREAGERAKVAVASTKRDVDPIGACVGLRGTRIQVISRELRGEKIDIIEWSHDPATFVARALSPAKVSSVTINESAEAEMQPSAVVIVPDNQLSLAIGKKGQNARLAAKLTSMRIDIKSESEAETERAPADAPPAEDRSALASMGVGPELIEALVAAGLGSPAAIVKAGREKLALVAEVGDRADALYTDAEKLVAAHQASRAAADDLGPPETPKETAETA
jgi:N utilization substance protein A